MGAEQPFIFIYLDNILAVSPHLTSHRAPLRAILQRLYEFGLVLNLDKCELGRQTVDFLGHQISAPGEGGGGAAFEACGRLRKAELRPLQFFLRLVNFHRRFIPSAPKILRPLADALRSSGNLKITLTPSMETAFQVASGQPATPPPGPSRPLPHPAGS